MRGALRIGPRGSRRGGIGRASALRIGAYFVIPLYQGSMARDGGVAFGMMPKREWSRVMRPDAANNVSLGVTFFLVQGHGLNILVDAGIGDKRDAQALAAFGVDVHKTTDELLGEVGLTRSDIQVVVVSHLHVASAGGLTRLNEDGAVEPAFPEARVVVQNGEWERAIHTNLRTRGLYSKEDYEALLWHQQLELIEGVVEVAPGLFARATGGHTKAHQIVVIESQGEGAIFWSDLIPTLAHLRLDAISAIDLYPITTMEQKAELMDKAVEQKWVSFFSRDAEVAAALLTGNVRSAAGVHAEVLIRHPIES